MPCCSTSLTGTRDGTVEIAECVVFAWCYEQNTFSQPAFCVILVAAIHAAVEGDLDQSFGTVVSHHWT